MKECLDTARFAHRVVLITSLIAIGFVLLSFGEARYKSSLEQLKRIDERLVQGRRGVIAPPETVAEELLSANAVALYPLLLRSERELYEELVSMEQDSLATSVFDSYAGEIALPCVRETLPRNSLSAENLATIELGAFRACATLLAEVRERVNSAEIADDAKRNALYAANEARQAAEIMSDMLESRQSLILPIITPQKLGYPDLHLVRMPDDFSIFRVEQVPLSSAQTLMDLREAILGPAYKLLKAKLHDLSEGDYFYQVRTVGQVLENADGSSQLEFPDMMGQRVLVDLEYEIGSDDFGGLTFAESYDQNRITPLFDGDNFVGVQGVWSEIYNVPLSEAIDLIAAQMVSSESSLDAFGLSIPNRGVRLFAPTVVLISLLNLIGMLLHAGEVARLQGGRSGEIAAYPWLLTSPNKASRL